MYKNKYLKYKNKYIILKNQIGSSNLNAEELAKARQLSAHPFSFPSVLSDGKPCEYTLRDKPLKDVPEEIFYKNHIVYRGLMKTRRFNLTLDELIKEFTEKGGMASSLAEITKNACGGNKDLLSNMSGTVNVIHTTTQLHMAADFSVSQSMGHMEDGNGFILCFNINEHRGIYLPSIDGSFDFEAEVAISGILELKDLLWIVSVENYLPVDLWINEPLIDIIKKYISLDKPLTESFKNIIKIITKNTVSAASRSDNIIKKYLDEKGIEYSRYYPDMIELGSSTYADEFMEKNKLKYRDIFEHIEAPATN